MYAIRSYYAHYSSIQILNWSLLGMFISGIVMLLWHPTAWSFAFSMFGVSYFMGMSRPLCNHMVLEQVVITSYSIHYTKLYEQYQQEQTKILGCRLTPAHRLLRSHTKGWHLDFKAAGLSASYNFV